MVSQCSLAKIGISLNEAQPISQVSNRVKEDKAAQNMSIPAIARILVPVDKAPLSMKAASYAIHLAELEKAKELIVMHVVEDIKQGGAIGLRAKYGDTRMIEGFRKAMLEDM
jgi:hypothetical protein